MYFIFPKKIFMQQPRPLFMWSPFPEQHVLRSSILYKDLSQVMKAQDDESVVIQEDAPQNTLRG